MIARNDSLSMDMELCMCNKKSNVTYSQRKNDTILCTIYIFFFYYKVPFDIVIFFFNKHREKQQLIKWQKKNTSYSNQVKLKLPHYSASNINFAKLFIGLL